MERLTKRLPNGKVVIDVLKVLNKQQIVDRLVEFEDELENGTFVKPPCKVGDERWILNDPYFVADIFLMKVEAIKMRLDELYICGYHEYEYFEGRISFSFNTKEEAEKRLEELRGCKK